MVAVLHLEAHPQTMGVLCCEFDPGTPTSAKRRRQYIATPKGSFVPHSSHAPPDFNNFCHMPHCKPSAVAGSQLLIQRSFLLLLGTKKRCSYPATHPHHLLPG